MFVKNQLRELKKDLQPESPESPQDPKGWRHEDKVKVGKETERRHTNRDNFLKIALSFLRQMKQDQLADSLQSRKHML